MGSRTAPITATLRPARTSTLRRDLAARAEQTAHAVYEACGFGLQHELTALGAQCRVNRTMGLNERRERVKADAHDATALV